LEVEADLPDAMSTFDRKSLVEVVILTFVAARLDGEELSAERDLSGVPLAGNEGDECIVLPAASLPFPPHSAGPRRWVTKGGVGSISSKKASLTESEVRVVDSVLLVIIRVLAGSS